jgi:AmmeMemoRadiSam system protein A
MTPDASLGHALITIARNALGVELGRVRIATPAHPALDAPGATFVTLTRNGDLRGCIGSLEARRPLRIDVHANALAAAFRDPRFPPLTAFELDATQVEVSLLSASVPITVADEGELLRRLVAGVDGVTLEYGRHRATFLPQVWESLADPSSFLTALKRKAGLPPGCWDPRMRFSRYAVTKWTEADVVAVQP